MLPRSTARIALLLGLLLPAIASTLAASRTTGPTTGRPVARAQTEAPPAHYWYSIGTVDPLANFGEMTGVAGSMIANDCFAVDRANHRIYRFDMRGQVIWSRGGYGSGEGQFAAPLEIDVDGEDRVFVIDSGNQRVQVFDPSGAFLDSWGSRGTGDGQFIEPIDIALSRQGTVYLLDRALGRVQRLRANGDIISSFGTEGEGRLNRPEGISVAPDGQIWIADTGNDRILRVSSRGTVLGSWEGFGTPVDVLVGANSEVYVLEADFGLIKRFDENMNAIGGWGSDFGRPVSLGGTEGNLIYVADAGKNRIERFTSGGEFETLWGGDHQIEGELLSPSGLAVSASGTLYVLDERAGRTHRYTLAGAWRDSFGQPGEEPGQLRLPRGIAASPDSTIYIADTGNDRVQRLGSSGSSPQAFGGPGAEQGRMERPGDVAVSRDETGGETKVFVADSGNHRIQRFGRTGQFEASWGARGPVAGAFRNPQGIEVAPDGTVWVADTENHRLQAFDGEGRFLRELGGEGEGPGQLQLPLGLEASSERLFVADSGNRRAQAYALASGAALGAFGLPERGRPGLLEPREVALGSDGRIFVSDPTARRIQVFSPDLPSGWRLSYYANLEMSGHAARFDEAERIDFNWADGRPAPGLPADGFALRAEGYLSAASFGVHALQIEAAGGARVWVGGHLVLDRWDSSTVAEEASFEGEAGELYTVIEFQDPEGPASLSIDWRPNGGSLPTRTPRPTTPTPTPGPGGAIHLPILLRALDLG